MEPSFVDVWLQISRSILDVLRGIVRKIINLLHLKHDLPAILESHATVLLLFINYESNTDLPLIIITSRQTKMIIFSTQ